MKSTLPIFSSPGGGGGPIFVALQNRSINLVDELTPTNSYYRSGPELNDSDH